MYKSSSQENKYLIRKFKRPIRALRSPYIIREKVYQIEDSDHSNEDIELKKREDSDAKKKEQYQINNSVYPQRSPVKGNRISSFILKEQNQNKYQTYTIGKKSKNSSRSSSLNSNHKEEKSPMKIQKHNIIHPFKSSREAIYVEKAENQINIGNYVSNTYNIYNQGSNSQMNPIYNQGSVNNNKQKTYYPDKYNNAESFENAKDAEDKSYNYIAVQKIQSATRGFLLRKRLLYNLYISNKYNYACEILEKMLSKYYRKYFFIFIRKNLFLRDAMLIKGMKRVNLNVYNMPKIYSWKILIGKSLIFKNEKVISFEILSNGKKLSKENYENNLIKVLDKVKELGNLIKKNEAKRQKIFANKFKQFYINGLLKQLDDSDKAKKKAEEELLNRIKKEKEEKEEKEKKEILKKGLHFLHVKTFASKIKSEMKNFKQKKEEENKAIKEKKLNKLIIKKEEKLYQFFKRQFSKLYYKGIFRALVHPMELPKVEQEIKKEEPKNEATPTPLYNNNYNSTYLYAQKENTKKEVSFNLKEEKSSNPNEVKEETKLEEAKEEQNKVRGSNFLREKGRELRKLIIKNKNTNETLKKYFKKFYYNGIVNDMKKTGRRITQTKKSLYLSKINIDEPEGKIRKSITLKELRENEIKMKLEEEEKENRILENAKRMIDFRMNYQMAAMKNALQKWDIKTKILRLKPITQKRRKTRKGTKSKKQKKEEEGNLEGQNENIVEEEIQKEIEN